MRTPRPLVAALLALSASGCLKDHNTFKDWLYSCNDCMAVPRERSHLYGYLRFPELILQPSGGLTTPTLSYTSTAPGSWDTTRTYDVKDDGGDRLGRVYEQEYRSGDTREGASTRGTYDQTFITHNGGLLDLIPYRVWTAKNLQGDEKIGRSFFQPVLVMVGYPFLFLRRAPVYLATDLYKTAMLPVAWAHYRKK